MEPGLAEGEIEPQDGYACGRQRRSDRDEKRRSAGASGSVSERKRGIGPTGRFVNETAHGWPALVFVHELAVSRRGHNHASFTESKMVSGSRPGAEITSRARTLKRAFASIASTSLAVGV